MVRVSRAVDTIRDMVVLRWLALAVGLGLGLSVAVGACAPAATPTPAPSPTATPLAIDPCTLLSADDLSSTLALPAKTGTRKGAGLSASCTWQIGPAIVLVTIGPLDSRAFASGLAQGGSVDGIGEQAYFTGVTHELHFAQHGVAVVVAVSNVALLQAESDELALASAVAGHL